MDQLSVSPETSAALSNLSAKDKQELNQFVVNESQKANIQQSMFSPSSQPPLLPAFLSLTFSSAIHSLTGNAESHRRLTTATNM
jgi:hypothetical protein